MAPVLTGTSKDAEAAAKEDPEVEAFITKVVPRFRRS
jgi:hypothetical protein